MYIVSGIFANGSRHVMEFGFWNPGNFCLWNPKFEALESRTQLKESGITYSNEWNPESKFL